ncbi:AraC family transcriptional regulator [Paenibacillus sp. HB172176]|uniref:AraC family transcriptional regulator n=1 Tax=Paenibacillus sp. HB172176 TaxID=2493690 RepID=UPI00143B97FC|nr:AraC family transcriptional regulator [Paenibacillus sp. HB172176]
MRHAGAADRLKELLNGIPFEKHFRIHKMFDLTVGPSWQIEKDRRNADLHLLYVKSGRGSYWLEGVEEELCAGKVIFVSNGFGHSSSANGEDLPAIMPIRFGIYSNASMKEVPLSEEPFCLILEPDSAYGFREKFERLYAYFMKPEAEGRDRICSSVLFEILMDLLHSQLGNGGRGKERRIERIRELMVRFPERRQSVKELASLSQLSSKQFSRLFQRYYGVTPKQFQIHASIRKAQYLLSDTSLSLSEIAEQLGYPDAYSFSKQFKQVTGHSPKFHR